MRSIGWTVLQDIDPGAVPASHGLVYQQTTCSQCGMRHQYVI